MLEDEEGGLWRRGCKHKAGNASCIQDDGMGAENRVRKRGLLDKVFFIKVYFLETLAKLEILELLENSQTVENKGEWFNPSIF